MRPSWLLARKTITTFAKVDMGVKTEPPDVLPPTWNAVKIKLQ